MMASVCGIFKCRWKTGKCGVMSVGVSDKARMCV